MTLSGPGVADRRGQPLHGMAVHLKRPNALVQSLLDTN